MKYKCGVCGYIYDEEKEGVKFADLPDDWRCPVCGEGKEGFSPVDEDDEPAPAKTEAKKDIVYEKEDLRELTPGQLSAVCSNLARACQKQQLAEESELFMKIADYYGSNAVAPDNDGVSTLLGMLNSDIGRYPGAKKTASVCDRGSLRVLTWNEKVTMIVRTLLERYEKDPHFLDNTNVYVCDICGFIYIGDEPPEICPVCKVPGFMFIQIKRKV